jgi:MFS family permease
MRHIKSAIKGTTHHLSNLTFESILVLAGCAIEYYSVFLYGYASSVINVQFFISDKLLLTQSILLSFVMGPLGAIICGHIGDTLGRKKVLVATISVFALSTFFISILPGYDSIGITASILSILLRSIQTMAIGGDVIGLVTFLLEDAPSNRRGLFGGLMSMGSGIGVLLAVGSIALTDPVNNPIDSWRWRLPMSLSIFGLILSHYFYSSVGETATFRHYKRSHYKTSIPIIDLFRRNFPQFCLIVGLTASVPIITIVVNGVIPYMNIEDLGIRTRAEMATNAIAMSVFAICAPFFGALSDQIGRKPVLLAVAGILLVTSAPIFYILSFSDLERSTSIQVFFAVVTSAYFGVTFATCIEHLPTHVRYTGTVLGYYSSFVIFGGSNGQYIVKALIDLFSKDASSVIYLLAGAFLLLVASLFIKDLRHDPLSEE